MFSFFSNLSIYWKILMSFLILGVLAFIMAFFGFFNLSQINNAIKSLTPRIQETSYLNDINSALNTFDKDLERYVTMGGEENKDRLLEELNKAQETTAVFSTSPDSELTDKLTLISADLQALSQNTADLIATKEEFRTSGSNEKIMQIYILLQSLDSSSAGVKQVLTDRFNSSLQDQRESISLATRQFVVIVLGMIILGVILSFLLSRAITQPIAKLRDTANTLSSGNYRVRIDVASDDEIGQLATSFNEMGENLLMATTKLEGEVAKRTEELSKKITELDTSNQLLIRREEELTIVNERLRELDKAKSEFISVAAHQLRTPLSAVKWILSLLIDEESAKLSAEQRSLVMKGYDSNERVINIINDMLVVTRIESGKLQYNFTLTHIEDLIESVLLDFDYQIHIRKMNLSFEKPSVQLPYVSIDSEKMRGVIQNLIENALRYTKDNGKILIKAVLENNMIKVSVQDNGIGIPEHQKSSIFSKFFRADNATKVQASGSGLGLFIAKNTVEKHGGKISFESETDVGTTFFFTIPVADKPA
ncbi:cell wall metabolism sensor histidine kinase WalK [Patescibacteria group bacterium]|nr:cell wall metabolism sensor histidine kinase WalK [Patescibacteria group bacterium]